MKSLLYGNIVLPDMVMKSACIELENGKINAFYDQYQDGAVGNENQWILPGFIDVHMHGIGCGEPATKGGLIEMAAFAPSCGVSRLCPTLGTASIETTHEYLSNIRELVNNPVAGALIAGAHLEGPYMNPERPGGMDKELLRKADAEELKHFLSLAGGYLKILTISPEITDSELIMEICGEAGCVVSAGHTICGADRFDHYVDKGVSHICHLFDTFEGRKVHNGVSQPALTDMILLDDRLTCEIIMDGLHVPPSLVKLALKAAGPERIIAITDSMQGAGLPDGKYTMSDGREYILTNGGVCTLEDGTIVGSCLTMNQAFINMVSKFGFNACEASKALSGNPAKLLGLDNVCGKLEAGMSADIAVLNPDGSVEKCFVEGNEVYAS